MMSDTGLIGGYVPVYAVTSGTMTSGRPLYQIGSSTWKGLNYASLQVWRAYSQPGSNRTYFKLGTPLDSNRIHIRVDNIRGDFLNWEAQTVRGYLNGVQVSADFKDPVNGATVSGSTISGGSGTSSAVQSSMRVFFHGPVDSIVVQQASVSDWIIAELMMECDILLPVDLLSWSAENKDSYVNLAWKLASKPDQINSFFVERSMDGRRFQTIGNIDAVVDQRLYQFNDQQPADGRSFYRLRIRFNDMQEEYSNIISVNRRLFRQPTLIYPNPASNYFIIETSKNSTAVIYSEDGRKVKSLTLRSGSIMVETGNWSKGIYFIRIENEADIQVKKLLIK